MRLKLAAIAAFGLLAACETVPPQNFDGTAVLGNRPAGRIAPPPPPPPPSVAPPAPRTLTPEMVDSALPPPPMEMGIGGGQPLSSLDDDAPLAAPAITQSPLPQ